MQSHSRRELGVSPLDFFSFHKSFEAALSRLKLPADCTQHEPEWEPTLPPLFWQVTVVFDFAGDKKHIRIWESYDKIAGLYMSRRVQWAYHYGCTESVDEDGKAQRGSPDDALDLRIDTSSGLHMHYQKHEPHYRQEQIEGLELKSVEAIDFIRAVLRHRRHGEDFSKILRFKIKCT